MLEQLIIFGITHLDNKMPIGEIPAYKPDYIVGGRVGTKLNASILDSVC